MTEQNLPFDQAIKELVRLTEAEQGYAKPLKDIRKSKREVTQIILQHMSSRDPPLPAVAFKGYKLCLKTRTKKDTVNEKFLRNKMPDVCNEKFWEKLHAVRTEEEVHYLQTKKPKPAS